MQIARSNDLDVLLDRLASDLSAPPASLIGSVRAVACPETIVVQSRGMERWVSMGLSAKLGVFANARFEFPRALVRRWVDDSSADGLPDVWERESLVWAIAAELPDLLERDSFAALAQWLSMPDPAGVRLLQLSSKLANVFDDYAVFRPDMVLRWQEGLGQPPRRDDAWQPELWRALCDRLGTHHFASRARDFIARAADGDLPQDLPPRISLFGITTLPPVYVRILGVIAQRIPVRMYLRTPSEHWYADDRPAREIHRLERAKGKSADELHVEEGHPLLASLGRVARDFQWILTDIADDVGVTDAEVFVDAHKDSMLGRLQRDIRDRAPAVAADSHETRDRSIQIHVCHGAMREVEVLRDQLLETLREDPSIRPRDIIVMMPDVESYAPMIEAVFGGERSQELPFRVSDRAVETDNRVWALFRRVLNVTRGRLTATEVFGLLAEELVSMQQGLSLDEVDRLTVLAADAGVRWGENAAHRSTQGLPADGANTWRFGLDRLLLGYVTGQSLETQWCGVLPSEPVDGAAAETVGVLAAFVGTLATLREQVSVPRSVATWSAVLRPVLERFIHRTDSNAWQHQAVIDALRGIAERSAAVNFDTPVSIDVVIDVLDRALADGAAAHGFLSGGVTFCALLPMRSIPFRVVCLVGMNHDAFPRQGGQPGFNLLKQAPRRGDRSSREDDRYLFLEALLSAGDRFVVTYVGRGIQDNKPSPPSVCVSELLDVLGAERDDAIRDRVVTVHPLQPFCPRYFSGSDGLVSYATHWHAGVSSLVGERQPRKAFLTHPLPAVSGEDELDVEELVRFFKDPAQAILSKRYGIRLDEDTVQLDDREPFSLDGLSRSLAGRQMLEQVLSRGDAVEARSDLRAAGVLPMGALGEVHLDALEALVGSLVREAEDVAGVVPPAAASVAVPVSGITIVGRVSDTTPAGRLVVGFSKLRPKLLLTEWIRHLVWSAARADIGPPVTTILVGPAQKGAGAASLRFHPVQSAQTHLSTLLDIRSAGLATPLPFFVDVAKSYVEDLARPISAVDALNKARNALQANNPLFGGNWNWTPYSEMLWDGVDPLAAGSVSATLFTETAEAIMGPLLQHLEAR